MKILLAEDDIGFGSLLKNYLEMHRMEVIWCETGARAYSIASVQPVDFIISDVMMPVMDGFTWIQEIRKTHPHVPVIFLTARNQKEDFKAGFQSGADDYVTKPFDPEILLWKIQALHARVSKEKGTVGNTVVQLGDFQFVYAFRTLEYKGIKTKLTPKEAELLQLLIEHKNQILPRELALKKIWKESNYFTTRSMDVYLAKLRKHLLPDARVQIENLHQKGFTLIAPDEIS